MGDFYNLLEELILALTFGLSEASEIAAELAKVIEAQPGPLVAVALEKTRCALGDDVTDALLLANKEN